MPEVAGWHEQMSLLACSTNKWIVGRTDGVDDVFAIRREVFMDEQHVPEEIEVDELEDESLHLLLYDDGEPVACGRIWFDGKMFRIGRCAVRKDARGQGIGDLLVRLLLFKVFQYRPSKVGIHAQSTAKDFYSRYGFAVTGESFDEAGIEHVPMEITKETLVFPSPCGDKHYSDLFEETTPTQP